MSNGYTIVVRIYKRKKLMSKYNVTAPKEVERLIKMSKKEADIECLTTRKLSKRVGKSK